MIFKISPSILSADFANLQRDVSRALEGGTDYIHVDVMDGHFVPNITVGIPVVRSLRKAAGKAVLDVHLMIEEPGRYADAFIDAGADILTFHLESRLPSGAEALLRHIKSRGARAGLSIRPGTPVSELSPYVGMCDLILIMTVEPGFGGQDFIPYTMEKIRETRKLIDELNPRCELEIDGGIDETNLADTLRAGANVIVMGSAVFGPGRDPAERIKILRAAGETC